MGVYNDNIHYLELDKVPYFGPVTNIPTIFRAYTFPRVLIKMTAGYLIYNDSNMYFYK